MGHGDVLRSAAVGTRFTAGAPAGHRDAAVLLGLVGIGSLRW